MYAQGIYVIGFFYPVVAKGQARIRVQLSAAHEKEHLDRPSARSPRSAGNTTSCTRPRRQIIEKYGL